MSKLRLICSFVMGAIPVAAAYYFRLIEPTNQSLILATLASVAVTMMGFLLAAVSILVAASSNKLLRNMQKTKHWSTLVHQLFLASTFYLTILLFSFAFLFTSTTSFVECLYLVLFLFCVAVIETIWVGIRLFNVIHVIGAPQQGALE